MDNRDYKEIGMFYFQEPILILSSDISKKSISNIIYLYHSPSSNISFEIAINILTGFTKKDCNCF